MKFTADQNKALSEKLDGKHVKQRDQGGRKVSYIEGWQAIAEANRIFGFDGWTRETIDLKCVSEKGRTIGRQQDAGWGVTYIAKVRIVVGDAVAREGCGAGHGIDRDLGQAHESALKEAETDAMKRALMTFGNPFGLALYDKEQTEVERSDPPKSNGRMPKAQQQEPRTLSALAQRLLNETSAHTTPDGLNRWWSTQKVNKIFDDLSDAEYQIVFDAAVAKKNELNGAQDSELGPTGAG